MNTQKFEDSVGGFQRTNKNPGMLNIPMSVSKVVSSISRSVAKNLQINQFALIIKQ